MAQKILNKSSILLIIPLLIGISSPLFGAYDQYYDCEAPHSCLTATAENVSTNPIQAINFGKKTIKLAQEKNAPSIKAEAQFLICSTLNGSMGYDSLFQYCQDAYQFFSQKNDKTKTAYLKNYMAVIWDIKNEKQKSISLFEEAIQIFSRLDHCEGLGHTYNNYGVVYTNFINEKKSLEHYFKALKYNKECGKIADLIASYHNIGTRYLSKKHTAKAEEYLKKGLKLAEAHDHYFWKTSLLIRLGSLYQLSKQYEEAFSYFQNAFTLANHHHDNYLISLSLIQIGKLYEAKGYYYEAIVYYKDAEKNQLLAEKEKELDKIYGHLAHCYFKLQDLQLAEFYTLKQDSFLAKNGQPLGNTLLLAQISAAKKEFAKANQYYENYIHLMDSISALQLMENISRIEDAYEMSQAKTELELLKQKNHLINLYLLLAVITIVAITGFFLLKAYERRKYSTKLKEEIAKVRAQYEYSNQELQKFVYVASHDLKSPLRNITGFLTLIKRKASNQIDNEINEYLDYAISASHKMSDVISDVLEYNRLEYMDNEKIDIQLSNIIEEVKKEMPTPLQQKNGEIHYFGAGSPLFFNPEQLKLLMNHLIENGLKYNRSNPPIVNVNYTSNNKETIIQVEDNGIGIPEEYRQKVFGIFKRLHPVNQFNGTGIGLSICQKIVEKNKGTIHILDNPNGQGITVEVKFPQQTNANV